LLLRWVTILKFTFNSACMLDLKGAPPHFRFISPTHTPTPGPFHREGSFLAYLLLYLLPSSTLSTFCNPLLPLPSRVQTSRSTSSPRRVAIVSAGTLSLLTSKSTFVVAGAGRRLRWRHAEEDTSKRRVRSRRRSNKSISIRQLVANGWHPNKLESRWRVPSGGSARIQ